jgi:NAD(P)-dependent dehydrogenase (short-subunit alcohol dehydrogenase family)
MILQLNKKLVSKFVQLIGAPQLTFELKRLQAVTSFLFCSTAYAFTQKQVTSISQTQIAANEIEDLDVLINNAGIAIYDDLSDIEVIEKHMAVNFLGALRVTQAFLPLLKRSKGSIVNNLSLAGLAALPVIPSYSISKAAAFNMTQSLRALLAADGVVVHSVVLGPIDTDMNRGFEIPKASTESAAIGIFDGLEKGEEDIFPDPVSQSIADAWRTGAAKALEQQFKAFVPERTAAAA